MFLHLRMAFFNLWRVCVFDFLGLGASDSLPSFADSRFRLRLRFCDLDWRFFNWLFDFKFVSDSVLCCVRIDETYGKIQYNKTFGVFAVGLRHCWLKKKEEMDSECLLQYFVFLLLAMYHKRYGKYISEQNGT